MNNKNNAVAPVFRPTGMQPDTITIPQAEPRTQRERVVTASNQSVPLPIAMILLGVFAIASIAIGYFGGDAVGASVPVRIVFSGALMLVMALVTMAFITGDAAALFEAREGERTERKALDVESERVDATLQVALAHEETTQQLNRYQYDERMAELTYGNQLANMQEDVAWLTQRYAEVADVSEGSVIPVRHNYVPNDSQDALIAINAWLATLYNKDGGFNPDTVHVDKRQIKSGPWNSEWKGKKWVGDAKKTLASGDDSILIPIVRKGRVKAYELRYDRLTDAHRVISPH